MIVADVVARLDAALASRLPGRLAQDWMAPVPRREWPPGFNIARVRHAAALLLIFPKQPPGGHPSSAHIVLTVRSDHLRHAGQVSLPGGVVEAGETFEQAALREAHEEIALDRAGVRVLGALTPLDIPVSGFRLHPIVGALQTRPTLTPADGEVAKILEVDLDALLAPATVAWRTRPGDRIPLEIPGFHLGGYEIWGATAMVLAEFLALLGWLGPLRI